MDADAIHREVERRKKRVETLLLRENVWTLFDKHIKSYPGWREHIPDNIYPRITDPIQMGPNLVQVTLGNEKWLFSYSERSSPAPSLDDEIDVVGTLVLSVDDKLVFEFEILITTHLDQYDSSQSYHFWDTKAFIEGPWIVEVDQLLSATEQHEAAAAEARKKQRREDPKALDELKKRFGI
jgi:hypothetical protein